MIIFLSRSSYNFTCSIVLIKDFRDNIIYTIEFNNSNTFGTMKIFSGQGLFELMSVNHNARSEDIEATLMRTHKIPFSI